jgi:hypothetical protein
MMLGLSGLRGGMSGINTCDLVVDGNGTAWDCSLWSNLLTLACWNPLSPCAAAGCTNGQPCTVDNSQSQLGPTVASIAEGGGAAGGGVSVMGISLPILLGLGILAIVVLKQ